MLISIHDKTLQRVAFIDNEKPETLHFFDDIWHRYLTEATSTFDFSVPKTGNAALQYLTEKNYVSFRYGGQDYLFNIMRTEETESELACYCENLNLELLNEMSPAFKSGGTQTFAWYFNNSDLVGGKNFSDLVLGINEVSDYSRSLEWEGTDTKLARLLSLVNKFDAECEFVTELNRDGSLKRIVLNVYKEHDDTHQGVGTRRQDVTLYYGKEIDGIRRTVDKTGLYNAIYPQGKDGLSITTVEKTEYDADGRVLYYTHSGQPYIYAPQTAEEYPAQISSKDDPWILYRWEYETENINTLYGQALAKLKEISIPAVTYEVEGSLMLEIGDTVKIHDDKFTPTLLLEARVSEQEVSFSDPTKNKNVFSNFKALENKLSTDITGRLDQLIQEALPYTAEILSDNGTVFRNGEGETTLTARVLKGNTDVSSAVEATWVRADAPQTAVTALSITISATDVIGKAVYKFAAKNKEGSILATAEVTVTHVLDGTGGEPGVSATAIEEQFYLSTSDTTPTGDNWQTVCPAWSSGKYIWSRYKCSWSDDRVTYTTPTLATGLNTANSTANVAKDTADTALGEVSAVAVRIGDLEAENVTITNKLSATEADIKKLKADVAEIGDLSAVTADIENLKADVAEIDTALIGKADIDLANIKNGCITTAMIGTGVIGTTQIADGSITDAKIVGLTANKITAGRLDAAQIEVVNLNAANITVGTINGVQIAPGAITGDKLAQQVNDQITGAANTAQQAQTTADGKNKIYYQNTQPGLTGNKKGDTWFDTANGYKAYVWDGTKWSASPFGSGALSDAVNSSITTAGSNASTALANAAAAKTAADQAVKDAQTAQSNASAAKTAADQAAKDLEAAEKNLAAVTGRVDATEEEIAAAQAAVTTAQNKANAAAQTAATAQSTADTAKQNAATAQTKADSAYSLADQAKKAAATAQTSADGKNTVFYQATQPSTTGRKIGDTWFDTDDGNRIYRWDGSKWTAAQLGTNAIANAAITNALIANLDAGKITTGTLAAARIGAESITAEKLAAGSVIAGKLAANAVTASTIVAGAVTLDKLAANSVNASKIVAGSITAAQLAANTITGDKIAATTIAAGNLAANSVTSDKIVAGAVTAGKISAKAVTANEIAAGTITAAQIAANAITATQLAAGAVTAAKIAAGQITADKIAAGAITADKFYGTAITSKNYVANSAGTKIDLSNGTIDTKNFKVDSAGNVAMTGTLTMQGAQTMTVRNASSARVGYIAFKAVSGQTWSPGALSIYGDGLLHMAAGDANSSKAFVDGYAGGTQLFELAKEGSNLGASIGIKNSFGLYTTNVGEAKNTLSGFTQVNGDLDVAGLRFLKASSGTDWIMRCGGIFHFCVRSGGMYVNNENNSGWMPVYAENFYTTSSERYKNAIREYSSTEALEAVKNSKIYGYQLKDSPGKQHVGFIAERQLPEEAIGANGESVDIYSMAAINWRATQEIVKQYELLQKQLLEQKQEIALLRAKTGENEMLEGRTKTININEYSKVGDDRICQFYANINSDAPETMDMGRSILSQALYKANRGQAMKDQADFETYVYNIQDEMIAEKNKKQEVTE